MASLDYLVINSMVLCYFVLLILLTFVSKRSIIAVQIELREKIMIEVGDVVYCNWGAMHPTEELAVLKIDGDRMWCEGGFTMLLADLRDMNENYRSPIGVYKIDTNNVYA